MLAGALAGLLAGGFAWIFGEPQVDVAIGFEQHMHAAAGEAPQPELVSRAVQSTAGLLTGILVQRLFYGPRLAWSLGVSPSNSCCFLHLMVEQVEHPRNRSETNGSVAESSVDADRVAEGFANRAVENEVGNRVETGRLAVDDH